MKLRHKDGLRGMEWSNTASHVPLYQIKSFFLKMNADQREVLTQNTEHQQYSNKFNKLLNHEHFRCSLDIQMFLTFTCSEIS